MTELAPGAITTADIYRELVGLQVRLAVIEQQYKTSDQVHNDHELRLRGVERFRWILLGASSAVGALSGVLANLLSMKGHS